MKKNILFTCFLVVTFMHFNYSGYGQCVTWTNLQNGAAGNGNIITHAGSSTGWGASGNSVEEIIPSNGGSVEFILQSSMSASMWGLNESDVTSSYSDLNYAFYVFWGDLYLIENGSHVKNGSSVDVSGISSGDKFKLVVTSGGTVLYYYNDNIIYVSGQQATSDLFFDCSMYYPGMSMEVIFPYNLDLEFSMTYPYSWAIPASWSTDIKVEFADIIDMGTIGGGIFVYGSYSGYIDGTWTQDDYILIFDPTDDFFPGETVTVTVTDQLAGTSPCFNPNSDPGGSISFPITTWDSNFITWQEHSLLTPYKSVVNDAMGADLDLDGDIDILTGGDDVHWFENTGNGVLSSNPAILNSAWFILSVVPVDLDGDNYADVVSSSAEGIIYWNKNNGDGTFASNSYVTTSVNFPESLFAADLDSDGDQDVLFADGNDDLVGWFKNNGSGSFGSVNVITSIADGADAVKASDLDGDKDIDVVFCSTNDDRIKWCENDGTGNFNSCYTISTAANGPSHIELADLDGDGDIDILSASYFDDKIDWYKNDGSGNFSNQVALTTGLNYANWVHAADLDGDGDMDVLGSSIVESTLDWWENGGSGNFSPMPEVSNHETPYSVSTADMNGNGRVDILFSSSSESKISWFRNIDGTPTRFSQEAQESKPDKVIENVSVYPNPVDDLITIELPDFENTIIEIFNVSGKKLMSVENLESAKTELSLRDIKDDLVFLHIRKPDEIKTFKIRLNR